MVALDEFFTTFSASIRSVGTAVTLAAVGVYLHHRNFVSSEGKRTLARISEQVTFPLFLFTKICYCNQDWSEEPCPDVTKSLADVWILLFWPAVVVTIGLLVGYAAAIVSGTPKYQVRSVLAACGFGNSTGLAVTLLTVVHANFPETSDLGKIDPTLFLSVYLVLYPVLQWGIGGWLLAPEGEEEGLEVEKYKSLQSKESGAEDEGLLSYTAAYDHQQKTGTLGGIQHNVLNNKAKESFYRLSRKAIGETDASLYISDADLVNFAANHPDPPSTVPELPSLGTMSPEQRHPFNSKGTPLSPIPDVQTPVVTYGPPPPDETTGLLSPGRTSIANGNARDSILSIQSQYEGETLCETCTKVLARCFQPPVLGALTGVFVASTPLRGIFVDLVDRSSQAPLQWFFDGLYAVGGCAVPINMIILGCNLSASYKMQQTKKDGEEETASNLLSQKTMIAIVIGKMLIMPLIGIVLALLLEAYVLDLPGDIDAPFYLVLMIVFITPTANNVMVMVELSGSNTKEGIAQVIALQYACAPLMLSLTMSLVVGIASNWG